MRQLVLLWFGAWLLFVSFAHGNLETLDAAMTMNASRALLHRGDAGLLRAADGGQWFAEQVAAQYIADESGESYGKTGEDGKHQYVWFPHGHVWLMVPFVALGKQLSAWLPDVEARYLAHLAGPDPHAEAIMRAEGQFVVEQGVVALGIPAAFGASTVVLLFLLARLFATRQAVARLQDGRWPQRPTPATTKPRMTAGDVGDGGEARQAAKTGQAADDNAALDESTPAAQAIDRSKDSVEASQRKPGGANGAQAGATAKAAPAALESPDPTATVQGHSDRHALLATATIALATQCFPLTRETLSDGPGLTLLLAALLVTVRAHFGETRAWVSLLGGAAAGAAVLTRYQHAFAILVMFAVVALAAVRQRRLTPVLWFAAGGLPFAALLFGTNYLRFGDLADTGYPPASTWFNYPTHLGVTKLLIAAGKGVLWFSPIVWLAVPLALRRRHVPQLLWLAWALLAIPMLMFGSTSGWQSGQCWGARYVTAGIVTFLAIVLPQAKPWQRWPKAFAVVVAAGLLVNATSLLAPTHGHMQLAGQAVESFYTQQVQRGELAAEELVHLDEADHFFFMPQFSPLHANWTYALLSMRGQLEDETGQRRDGSSNNIEPLFGVSATQDSLALGPLHWEDRGFRHLWFRFWGELLEVPWWGLLIATLLPGLLLMSLFVRGVMRRDRTVSPTKA